VIWRINGEPPEKLFQPTDKDNLDDLFYNVSARPPEYVGTG
jgi:hypothetical protein